MIVVHGLEAELLIGSGEADENAVNVHVRGLVSRLLRTGGYRPDRLLRDMAPMLADPAASVRGLHIFTFNQVERTEGWRRAQLA